MSAPAPPTFAPLPPPPYYAVIFASLRSPVDAAGYAGMADRMLELAAGQPGFLGVDSARGADQFGITVSYWTSLEAIAAWRTHAEHTVARETGRERWYERYSVRIARVERAWESASSTTRYTAGRPPDPDPR